MFLHRKTFFSSWLIASWCLWLIPGTQLCVDMHGFCLPLSFRLLNLHFYCTSFLSALLRKKTVVWLRRWYIMRNVNSTNAFYDLELIARHKLCVQPQCINITKGWPEVVVPNMVQPLAPILLDFWDSISTSYRRDGEIPIADEEQIPCSLLCPFWQRVAAFAVTFSTLVSLADASPQKWGTSSAQLVAFRRGFSSPVGFRAQWSPAKTMAFCCHEREGTG